MTGCFLHFWATKIMALSKRHRMVQNGTELVQNGTECPKGTERYRIKTSKRHRMVQNESVQKAQNDNSWVKNG